MKRIYLILIIAFCSISMANAQMALVASKGIVSYTNSGSIDSKSFPEKLIQQSWDRGERITKIAYGNGKWLVFFATNLYYGAQICSPLGAFPEEWIDENYKKGYIITSVAHGAEGWVVVMTQGLDEKQEYTLSKTFPAEWAAKMGNDRLYISTLCFADGMWCVVSSTNSALVGQRLLNYENTIPESVIAEQAKDGFSITDIVLIGEIDIIVVFTKAPNTGAHACHYVKDWAEADKWVSKVWNEDYTVVAASGAYR